MLCANRFRGAALVGFLVAAALCPAQAQEAPSQAPPAQEQPASIYPVNPASPTIFGPVRRTPPLSQAEFLPWPPQHPPTPSPTVSPQRLGQRPSAEPIPQVNASGSVCLRPVWVDPNIDPRFARPVFGTGNPIRREVMPTCVRTTE